MKIAISIHAPPRGATYDDGTRVLKSYLFQFTPLREGRLLFTMCIISPVYFNSRPSARGDGLQIIVISAITYFNSRPSARGDLGRRADSYIICTFQFTPLREGRRSSH